MAYPNAYVLWNVLGAAYQAVGRLPESVNAFRKTVKINKNYADGHSNLGAVLQQQGKTQEALKAYTRVIELKVDNPVLLP